MNPVAEGLREAVRLIVGRDPELLRITALSLRVSAAATLIAAGAGIPLGWLVATRRFPGRWLVESVLRTLLAFPTVVVGLLCYSLLRRDGPLGPLDLLFTPSAMVIGQTILALPIAAAFSAAAVRGVDRRARETALTLGATAGQAARAVLREGGPALAAAAAAAFGRVFAEVGVSMMLGGNIRFYTRNITTAIALETGRGEFALATALGMILLAVAFAVNAAMRVAERRGADA
ncbi:MAG: ABC transporter permease [bacterium]|nr:ABC transporter permease [bacterium]